MIIPTDITITVVIKQNGREVDASEMLAINHAGEFCDPNGAELAWRGTGIQLVSTVGFFATDGTGAVVQTDPAEVVS